MDKNLQFNTVDEYISQFPGDVQERLNALRTTILNTAPEAKEKISYKMPAYEFKGILVYFAAYKNHIGFYPTGNGIEAFQDKIKGYKTSKGTIQFPLNKPLPMDLIKEIVEFRVSENLNKSKK